MRHKKEKSETRKTANSVLFTAIALLFFAVMFFGSYYICIRDRKTIARDVIVEAEFVDISYHNPSTKFSRGSWKLVYEYIDENGVKYSGYGKKFDDEYEARSYIGTNVKIYIDGEGHSIIVGYEPGDRGSLIIAIVLIILTLVALAVYVKLLLVDKRKTKAKAMIGETNNINADVTSNEVDMTDLQRDELTTTDTEIEEMSNIEKK
ncbi:MAG: DUF3592 domain-containing protein [Clostridia bacterium]|nr:DUF3592 domain-containing protein [Clostridia bacterium]